GVAQAQMQQLGQARATFENMTKRYPELPEAHNNLGLVLAALGQSAEAKQAFEQALRANPGFELAKKNLTWLSPTPARANP
ncbi:MAG: tetratricopeptide repeat protein, partial [Burkholderiaceae bacterium]